MQLISRGYAAALLHSWSGSEFLSSQLVCPSMRSSRLYFLRAVCCRWRRSCPCSWSQLLRRADVLLLSVAGQGRPAKLLRVFGTGDCGVPAPSREVPSSQPGASAAASTTALAPAVPLSVPLSHCPGDYLSLCLFVSLSACLSVSLSLCLFVFL